VEIGRATHKRRLIANVAVGCIALALFLVTKCVQSLVTVILPAAAVHWMISNERRLAADGKDLPNVPLLTRAVLFVLIPGLSLAVIAFWFPVYARKWNPWGIYAIASFSLGLLLVKIYERYLLIRRRLKAGATPSRN
jgi:hypothetical protein